MQASSSSFHWSFIQRRSSLPTLHHAAKNGQAAFFSFDSHRGGSRLEINMLQPRQCHRHQLRNGYCTFRHMAFYYSRGSSSGVRIPLLLSSSSSSSSYYNLATSAAASSQSISSSSLASSSTSTSSTSKASSTLPFPEWWPPPSSTSDDDAALNHPNQYIKFADHVAHLVIPVGNTVAVPTHGEHEVVGENNSNADDRSMDNDATTPRELLLISITNVEEAVRYVLDCAIRRNAINLSSTTTPSRTITIPADYEYRRYRIEMEWHEGEEVSTDTRVLDPAYRHDPTLLPQHKPTLVAMDSNSNNDDTTISNGSINLIASELLALGSVWYLPLYRTPASSGNISPSSASIGYDRFDPANGSKPTRLTVGDTNRTIHPGDYFRVHFDPRRFVDANLYDWGRKAASVTAVIDIMDSEIHDNNDGSGGSKPGVLVKRDDDAGYIIIDKPANIPVHARVDNLLENVASCVGRMLWMECQNELSMALLYEGADEAPVTDCSGHDQDEDMIVNGNSTYMEGGRLKRRVRQQQKPKIEPLIYVATPQRLDQNTSGLLVVATKKSFASYFAKLLRIKTSRTLRHGGEASSQFSEGGVHKSYRCLVCIFAHETGYDDRDVQTIVANEVDRLRRYTHTIMRHFLEPSIRAPKRFVATVPEDAANADSYAECLLRLTNVSEAFVVAANNTPSYTLSKSLWGEHGMPDGCVAVAECEIELLTGRTHQIRGQLAAEGFPLVGDVQYGGAVPTTSSIWKERCKGRVESFLDSECLALQCCSLEFLDPQHDVNSDQWKRLDKWLSFRLDSAFWSPFLHKFTSDISTIASALND
ncbi:hypothetical protein ACHAWU_007995 [Discostella pseudostelligera]|uniref:Pseudouridine synthase RsuA/RluA-like domain-containing protein n=1 Tax=Discostella pseudostelligera TaxID=259834 RepID=A0ABD3LZJ1_9STRA